MDTNIIAPAEVGDIFRLYGEQFRQRYKLPKRHSEGNECHHELSYKCIRQPHRYMR